MLMAGAKQLSIVGRLSSYRSVHYRRFYHLFILRHHACYCVHEAVIYLPRYVFVQIFYALKIEHNGIIIMKKMAKTYFSVLQSMRWLHSEAVMYIPSIRRD